MTKTQRVAFVISHSTAVQLSIVIAVLAAVFAAGGAWTSVQHHDRTIERHSTDIETIKQGMAQLQEIVRQNAMLIAELRNERRSSPPG